MEKWKERVLSFLLGNSNGMSSSPSLLDRSCMVATATSFSTYRLIAEFLRTTRICPQVFVPFCGNSVEHIIRHVGLRGTQYRLFNHRTGDWQFGGTCEDLLLAGRNSCFLVPFNGSLPFSVQLSPKEWEQITSICCERNHLLWLDINMFGLAGSAHHWERELQCMHTILQSGVTCVISLGLEHPLGLYGNDLGLVLCIDDCSSSSQLPALENTLRRCSWELGITSPSWMERVVYHMMDSPSLLTDWRNECDHHRARFESTRQELIELYKKTELPPLSYQYLGNQTGPFSRVTYYRHMNEQLRGELGRYGIINLSSIVDCMRDHPNFPTSLY